MDFKSAKLNPFSYNLYYVKWRLKEKQKMLGFLAWDYEATPFLIIGVGLGSKTR
jgi:hypothetical protein